MQLGINLAPRRSHRRPAAFGGYFSTPVNPIPLAATASAIIATVVGSIWIAAQLHTDDGGILQLVVGLAIALTVLTHPSSFRDEWLWSVRGVFVGKVVFFATVLAGMLLASTGVIRVKLRAHDVATCAAVLLSADDVHQRATALRVVPRSHMPGALQILADWRPETCGRLHESGAF